MFGEEDIINNSNRNYTATCVSMTSKAIMIKKDDFVNIVL